jgi:hypothetical protein
MSGVKAFKIKRSTLVALPLPPSPYLKGLGLLGVGQINGEFGTHAGFTVKLYGAA